jgi:hypothetical protein
VLTIGSLFSGIGGLERGLEWAGLGPTLYQVEIDEYCRRVLAKHWPDALRFVDVRTLNVEPVPGVDLLCGGFPCTDTSAAGKQQGLSGESSGLWYYFASHIAKSRPRYVVVENVQSGAKKWLCQVRSTLHELGYRTHALGIAAADCGASSSLTWPTPVVGDGIGANLPHRRKARRNTLTMAVLAPEKFRWPTPTAGDAKAAGSRNLEGSKAKPGVSLTDAVLHGGSTRPRQPLWPTPSASRYGTSNNGCPGDGRDEYATKGTESLETMANRQGGALNPDWVEALLGLPVGWTDLRPSDGPPAATSPSTNGSHPESSSD